MQLSKRCKVMDNTLLLLMLHCTQSLLSVISPTLLSRSQQRDPQKCYKLVVVGHSLGAATAAVLSLLLRDRYPQLKCIGYGMPGSVYDWRTAQGEMRYDKIGCVLSFNCVCWHIIYHKTHYAHILSTNLMTMCVLQRAANT